MHLEFQDIENSLKDDVELLDHLTITKVQFLYELERNFDGSSILNPLTFGCRASLGQLLWNVQFYAVKCLKNAIKNLYRCPKYIFYGLTFVGPMSGSNCWMIRNFSFLMSIMGSNRTSYSYVPMSGFESSLK